MHIGALMVFAAAIAGSTPQSPRTGEDVVRLMHQRYAGKWYSTVTFVQKTTTQHGVETWYEAMRLPGLLRIDIGPLGSDSAIMFRNDSIYQVGHRAITNARPLIHPLLVLGFDVYAQSPDTTIAKLKRMSFDVTKVTSGSWQGKKVWIVGTADSSDSRANQFWIEQDNLLFVRMLRTNQRGQTNETQFNKYFPTGGGWISPEVVFLQEGNLLTKEEYSDVKTGMRFEADLFEPAKFGPPGWVK